MRHGASCFFAIILIGVETFYKWNKNSWKLNLRPRKSLGYRTPLEYCKQLFNFDF